MNIWQAFEIARDKLYFAKTGPLLIYLKFTGTEWYLAHKYADTGNGEIQVPGPAKPGQAGIDGLQWVRYFTGDTSGTIYFKPVMPDKPLVVRPKEIIKIHAGEEAQFFIEIPVWISLAAGKKGGRALCTLPVTGFSNTWFGDFASGELCYSLKSMLKNDHSHLTADQFQTVCPVKIKNESKKELDFERFCLRTDYLGIYRGRTRLWTNKINLSFKGEDMLSQITIGKKAPEYEKTEHLLSQARQPADNNLFKKSFQFIREITGF